MNKKRFYAILMVSSLLLGTQAMAEGENPAMLAHTCAGCHGTFGASAGDSMPIIGGQPKAYLVQSMKNYRDGKRHSTIMQRLAKGYNDDQIEAMAEFLSKQSWISADEKTDSKSVETGKTLHTTKGCAGCHGAAGLSPMPSTPRLAGQYSEYLYLQMKDYVNEHATIPASATVMRGMLKGASNDDIRALADFYASNK
jgi:sulfide dehydrogenase cytochrome subunit